MNETTVTVVGNVITEPTMRRVSEESSVVHFRVASTARRFDKATGQWADGDSFYANVTCWRRLADGAAASLTKGDPVIVTGRLHTRSYQVEGQLRWSTDVVAQAVGPDLSRCRASVQRNHRDQQPAGTAQGGSDESSGVGISAETGGELAA